METGCCGGKQCWKELFKDRWQVVIEKRLNRCTTAFLAGEEVPVMCDAALLTSVDVFTEMGCVEREVPGKSKLVHNSLIALLADAGLDPFMFLLLTPCRKDEVKDSIQCLDHGTGKQQLHTATSFLLRLIPRNNTARAPGKWERNVTFPFRLRGMWHRADGFCRIGTLEARHLFSPSAGMWVSELISANKAVQAVQVCYSLTTEELDWNKSGHVLNTSSKTNVCLSKMNGLDLFWNDIG